jgi:aryl-alcohol dehydrogenase-like predicted oxidoreductase
MGYGDGSREKWALGYDEALPFFRQALELGVTFWDTANIYSFGGSERIVGRAIKDLGRRDDIVLATKGTSTCMTVPAGLGCPVRRSWSRSTPR